MQNDPQNGIGEYGAPEMVGVLYCHRATGKGTKPVSVRKEKKTKHNREGGGKKEMLRSIAKWGGWNTAIFWG